MIHKWQFPCTVESNYDGDTFNVRLDLGFAFTYHAPVRLHGVDTPELRGGTKLTKAAAAYARDYVRQYLADADQVLFESMVWRGKYGRPIGDFWVVNGDVSTKLSSHLVALKLGVEYDGGSRRELFEQHIQNAKDLAAQGFLRPYGIGLDGEEIA